MTGSRANRLIAVDDAASQALGFSDGGSFYSQIAPGRVGDAEYWYNGNGANRRDDGKGLGHVFYAVNSLPRVAFFPTTADAAGTAGPPGTVEWTYAATGGRLRRVVTLDGAATETVDYAGSLVLKAGLIDFMSTGQGRLKAGYATGSGGQTGKKIGGWAHEYLLRDHLGSVRARFETAPRLTVAMTTVRALATVGQYDEYYPYGLRLAGRSYVVGDADDELFHGKRLDEGHGLDWTHYGWRYYDAAVGRWTMVDPADEFYTAYSYVGGDPVNLLDPDGAQIISKIRDAINDWGSRSGAENTAVKLGFNLEGCAFLACGKIALDLEFTPFRDNIDFTLTRTVAASPIGFTSPMQQGRGRPLGTGIGWDASVQGGISMQENNDPVGSSVNEISISGFGNVYGPVQLSGELVLPVESLTDIDFSNATPSLGVGVGTGAGGAVMVGTTTVEGRWEVQNPFKLRPLTPVPSQPQMAPEREDP